MSVPPIINPPMTMAAIQQWCTLLKALGIAMMMPTTSTKKTTNFLNAIYAANGMTVTQ